MPIEPPRPIVPTQVDPIAAAFAKLQAATNGSIEGGLPPGGPYTPNLPNPGSVEGGYTPPPPYQDPGIEKTYNGPAFPYSPSTPTGGIESSEPPGVGQGYGPPNYTGGIEQGSAARPPYGTFRAISQRGGPEYRPSNTQELLRKAAARRLGLD